MRRSTAATSRQELLPQGPVGLEPRRPARPGGRHRPRADLPTWKRRLGSRRDRSGRPGRATHRSCARATKPTCNERAPTCPGRSRKTWLAAAQAAEVRGRRSAAGARRGPATDRRAGSGSGAPLLPPRRQPTKRHLCKHSAQPEPRRKLPWSRKLANRRRRPAGEWATVVDTPLPGAPEAGAADLPMLGTLQEEASNRCPRRPRPKTPIGPGRLRPLAAVVGAGRGAGRRGTHREA